MKKTIITIVLLFVFMLSYGQIKMHPSGQVSIQATNTTDGVQIVPSGKTIFKPDLTASYEILNQTVAQTQLVKVWDVKFVGNPMTFPDDHFYVTGYGNAYASAYYTISYSGGGGETKGISPIENASKLLSNMNCFYYDNDEFKGFTPDFIDNPNIQPEAIEGLMKDLEINKALGLSSDDLEAVLPEAVRHDPDGRVYINYSAIVPVLVEAFKEQQQTIEALQQEIAELKNGEKGFYGIGTQESSKNALFQNTPNPTNSSTTIDCYLDSNVSKAVIAVYDLNGLQLKEYPIYNQGKNTIKIEANEFKPGMYMYSLLVDGKLIDTKRMVITSK